MGEWANGRMGEWANGRMGEWANGRMGEWANGKIALRPSIDQLKRTNRNKHLIPPSTHSPIHTFAHSHTRPFAHSPIHAPVSVSVAYPSHWRTGSGGYRLNRGSVFESSHMTKRLPRSVVMTRAWRQVAHKPAERSGRAACS